MSLKNLSRFTFIALVFFALINCKAREKEPAEILEINELIDLAEQYGKSGELEKALLFAKRAYELDPTNKKVRIQLSKEYATIGDKYLFQINCDLAKEYSEKAIEIYKDNDGANNVLASCALFEKKYPDCIKYAKEEIRLEKLYNNVSGAPYHILGECYIGLRDYDKAINNLLNDLRIDGFNENQAYFNSIFSLGRIYFIKGDSDESVKYLKKFLNEYEGLKPEKLKELLNSANTETVRMLDFIESGKKIGFPRGKEPAFYDDIIEILQKRQSK